MGTVYQHSKSYLIIPFLGLFLALTSPAQAQEWATVQRVIDGDTFVLANKERVRLIGVNTSEMKDHRPEVRAFAVKAKGYLRGLLEGKRFRLERDVSDRDRYGWLLRYVYLEDGRMVNALLVEAGYAQVMPYPPDVKYADLFLRLQREARKAGRGLWAGKPTPRAPPRATDCPVVGNKRSRIYHVPGRAFYQRMLKSRNRVSFQSEAEAQVKGYRRPRR